MHSFFCLHDVSWASYICGLMFLLTLEISFVNFLALIPSNIASPFSFSSPSLIPTELSVKLCEIVAQFLYPLFSTLLSYSCLHSLHFSWANFYWPIIKFTYFSSAISNLLLNLQKEFFLLLFCNSMLNCFFPCLW